MTDDSDLNAWVVALAAELDIDSRAVDVAAVLDLAAQAAHAIVRPAAPLTTFLAGLAAGRNGGDAAAIGEAIAVCTEAARAAGDH